MIDELTPVKKERFSTWLKKQNDRYDPVGDVSRDFLADPRIRNNSGYKKILEHLNNHGACDGAVDALERAFEEYNGRV